MRPPGGNALGPRSVPAERIRVGDVPCPANDYPYEDSTNLLRVSQYVDVMLGDGPLYQELHDVFDADYPPTPVHQLLASLPAMIRASSSGKPRYFPLIVTTNYDDALERAFLDAGEAYDLVVYIADGL